MKNFQKIGIQIAEKAGKALLKEFRKDDSSIRGTSKGIKTLFDLLADKIIKKEIEKNFPEHSYLTEETGFIDKKSDYLWIIDPLDGTSNFVNHNPFFSVSIALWYKGSPILGIIEVPALKERYVAIKGKGAWVYDLMRDKKRRARVSNVKELKNSYWVFCEGGENKRKRIADIFYNMYPKVKEYRKIGSAAIELAWVGTGRAEGYATTKISLWDLAAGMLFVAEAGGKNLHFNGKVYKWKEFLIGDEFDFMATNGTIKTSIRK
jgi:myo-inositol-1(or 4)-monophosphatase